MRIFVDVGNTRTKWCVSDKSGKRSYGFCSTSLREIEGGLPKSSAIDSIYVASVSSDEFNTALESVLSSIYGVSPSFVRSQAAACGVQNGYGNVGELGVDRWLAVVAAATKYDEAAVVVDAGSAVTIDIISSEKVYRGGYIMPGVSLMYRSLVGDTEKILNLSRKWPDDLSIPTSTHQAVNKGMALYITSAIEKLSRVLAQEYGSVIKIVLTGGDASSLSSLLDVDVDVIDHLVLDGLELVSKELQE